MYGLVLERRLLKQAPEARPYSMVIRWVDERNRPVNTASIENSFLLVNDREHQTGSVICVVQNCLVSQFEG